MKREWFDLDDKVVDSHHLAVSLIELSNSRGANVDRLLRGTGIFIQDIEKENIKVSCRQLFKLISNAEKLVVSQDLSFLLGRRMYPGNFGALSSLLMNCCSFNRIIRVLQCYQMQIFPFLNFTVENNEDKTYLIVNTSVAETNQTKFFVEVLCSALNSALKWRLGHQIPVEYYFNFSKPSNIYQYEENLGHRLRFNHFLTMISIENRWLNHRLLDSSNMVWRQQIKECKKNRKSESFESGLLQYLSLYLKKNVHSGLDEAASNLQVSPATLKRKLKEHGASFQKIQDRVRMQKAIFDIVIRNESNNIIAKKLHFNDLANFRRSFKRWTGMTPSEMKDRGGYLKK